MAVEGSFYMLTVKFLTSQTTPTSYRGDKSVFPSVPLRNHDFQKFEN